ncbi:MAG: hypothetical protein BHW44_11460 [Roseburia sp. 40_7]|nr:MAG: hypothetical protein BHW44_11460 [Roseburia sp. 40_7]
MRMTKRREKSLRWLAGIVLCLMMSVIPVFHVQAAGRQVYDDAGLFSEADIAEITEILKKEYAISDPNLTLDVQFDKEGSYEVLNPSSLQKVLFYLRNVPNGVMHMSTNIKGLVETSLNAGIMKLNKEELYISTSVRSSVKSRKEELTDRLVYLTEFLGGEISIEGDYPAWEYCADSRLREKVSEVYTRIFQKEPVFEAIHAGLECGMFADKIADLEPKERLSISSTERVYKFIVEFLRSMK